MNGNVLDSIKTVSCVKKVLTLVRSSFVERRMEILRLVVVLCALHLAKPLDSEVSSIEHDLRLNKRQTGKLVGKEYRVQRCK